MGNVPRVAFIAAGHVAENHFAALQRTRAGQLVALYDPNVELASRRSREWDVPVAHSVDQILQDPTIDAVYVLTPLEFHVPLTLAALDAGKHVLVEKPVARTARDILTVRQAARKSGRVCMPGHTTLYLPEIRRIRQLVTEGQLGTPVALYIHETYFMPLAKVSRYHGPIQEVLIHLLYMLLYLAGRPTALSAFTSHARPELAGETQVMVNLLFPSELLGHLFLSWGARDQSADPWTYLVKVLGTAGTATFNRRAVVTGPDDEAGNIYSPLYQEAFDSMNAYFLTKCIGMGEKPLSTLEDAADAATLLEAIVQAATARTVVSVQYDDWE